MHRLRRFEYAKDLNEQIQQKSNPLHISQEKAKLQNKLASFDKKDPQASISSPSKMDAALLEEFKRKTQQVKEHINDLVQQRDSIMKEKVARRTKHKRNESERIKAVQKLQASEDKTAFLNSKVQ